MHIFIDESGAYGGVGSGQSSVSAQGAIVVPTHNLDKLSAKYARMRLSLPKNKSGEVKGSLLAEAEVAAVIDLMRRNEVLFFASMIDTGEHSREDIERHRQEGIFRLGENLTNGHTPELRANVAKLQHRMSDFSVPLYVQMNVMTELLHSMMQQMILYHCQRHPKELERFHWVVDGKEPGVVTDWEDWWSNTIVVWLQAKSIARPGKMFTKGDYRFFQRFIMQDLPEYLRVVAPPVDILRGAGIDLQLMFRESFRFSSQPEPGLELVDIATNALRRALVGNLGEAGWLPLRGLMIHQHEVYVRPVGLHANNRTLARPYSKVLNRFREGGRIMMAPRFRRD